MPEHDKFDCQSVALSCSPNSVSFLGTATTAIWLFFQTPTT